MPHPFFLFVFFGVLLYLAIELLAPLQKYMEHLHHIFIHLALFVLFATNPTTPIDIFFTPVDDAEKFTVTLTKIVFELSLVHLFAFPNVNTKPLFLV